VSGAAAEARIGILRVFGHAQMLFHLLGRLAGIASADRVEDLAVHLRHMVKIGGALDGLAPLLVQR